MLPYTDEAYQLMHDGAIALARVESNGIRIDTEYLRKTTHRLRRRITHLQNKIQTSEVVERWKRKFKGKFTLGSTDQLGEILFGDMGFECTERTATGAYRTSEECLSRINHPFVKDYLKIKKMSKTLNTYLLGIRREVVNGFMHPFFNLHLVKTFRSSSDSFNFQNIPVRDPETGQMIRQAFIARPGRRIVEADYSGIEVSIAACYHQDPMMMKYLSDKTKDMHRDMAMECFKLSLEELTPADKSDPDEVKRAKTIRYCGKNMFVFPEFYGDWYIDCARSLWNAISSMDLKTRDGRSLYVHLREQGINELGDLNPKEKPRKGTMERHIQKVEQDFWTKRFPIYDHWKKTWVKAYRSIGYMLTKTGFICQGWLKRNEIFNYPVQGAAFHCLLRSLIHLQRKLKKYKMKSLIIGQIHDSLVSDVPDEELDDFLGLSREVMVDDLKDDWDWINVPIEIEAEVTPVDGNWFQKEEMKIG